MIASAVATILVILSLSHPSSGRCSIDYGQCTDVEQATQCLQAQVDAKSYLTAVAGDLYSNNTRERFLLINQSPDLNCNGAPVCVTTQDWRSARTRDSCRDLFCQNMVTLDKCESAVVSLARVLNQSSISAETYPLPELSCHSISDRCTFNFNGGLSAAVSASSLIFVVVMTMFLTCHHNFL